jgi:hypothetical protein
LLVRRHCLDALIVLMTIGAVFELALKRGTSQAAQVTLWFDVPAIVIMVLPLFVRRRFPFAARPRTGCSPWGCRSSTGA